MTAVIYARYSSDNQREESIEDVYKRQMQILIHIVLSMKNC